MSSDRTSQRRTLFDPTALRGLKLANRMAMAPMTRGRAGPQREANLLMAQYYGQRAGAGLIVTEATAISVQGYGWVGSPGIYTESHVTGWKIVTEEIHRRNGRIFLQLWHTGRVSHPDFLEGQTPMAPSAIPLTGQIHTPNGKKPFVTPRAMTRQEIAATVRDFTQAAQRAREAGFDGVEIHAANGYLIDQFINDGSNHRTDEYGGDVHKRLRFLIEVTEAVTQAWSSDCVGVRFSPGGAIEDSAPMATFTKAAQELSRFGLAYLHVIESREDVERARRIAPRMRAVFDGPFILNGGYDARSGMAALRAGEADLIAYGRLFLANPDLVKRFRVGAALNKPDSDTFYTSGEKGYIDYPSLHT